MRLDPNSVEANYRLGEFYLHTGKLPGGIPYMERAATLDPANYVVGYDLALAYFETQRYANARVQIQAMLRQGNSAELHSLLADVEEAAGNYLPAAAEYQTAAQMEPSEEHIFDWGTELLVHQTYAPAIKVLARGIELYPRSVKLNVGLGIALYASGDYPQAGKALCSATDLDASEAWPYLFLGKIYGNVSSSNGEEVRKRLRRFAQMQPQNARGLYYYAMSLWDRGQNSPGDIAEIESLLKRAVALDATLADAHLQLGILYEDQHKGDAATSEFQRAITLQPALSTAHYHLAQAYVRSGEKVRAQQEFRTFQQLQKLEAEETEKERNEIRQFVVTMKEQPGSSSAK